MMPDKKVAGIILAAGSSSRMGTPKQLLRIGQEVLLDRILSEVTASNLDPVVLVLGYRADEIKKGLGASRDNAKLGIVLNRNHSAGMSTSIIAGLSRVEKSRDHVSIILADMPYITSGLINLLIRRYLESGLPLAAIQKGGKRSHPVIIGRPLYPEIHRLRGDVGARELFTLHPDLVCLVEPDAPYKDTDIDTPEDFREFLRQENPKDPALP